MLNYSSLLKPDEGKKQHETKKSDDRMQKMLLLSRSCTQDEINNPAVNSHPVGRCDRPFAEKHKLLTSCFTLPSTDDSPSFSMPRTSSSLCEH